MSIERDLPPATDGSNRREYPRIPAAMVPSLTARVVGGAAVRLLDVSRRGAQLETSMHMRPGRSVCIRFIAADATVTLTGAVVRSTVAIVESEGVKYHTALAFAEDFELCDQIVTGYQADGPAATVPQGTGATEAAGLVDDYTVIVTGLDETQGSFGARLLANSW